MACSECKKKLNIKKEIEKETEFIDKRIVWFAIVWSLLAIYGGYSLIIKLL